MGMFKRKYVVSGNDAEGKYVEEDVWASSSKEALEIAQGWEDGVTYTVARKKGCGCGS